VDSGQQPFATDIERLRLLYALPLSGTESRILVVGSRNEAKLLLDGEAFSARVEVSSEIGLPSDATFDAVLLPLAVFGKRNESVGVAPTQPWSVLVREAHAALRPGGVLVGHLENLVSLATLRAALHGQISFHMLPMWRGALTIGAQLRALHEVGFDGVECFYVEPRISAPMALVPRSWWAAKTHFLRAVRRSRASYSLPGYLARLALAAAGLGGLFQPHVFIWTRRPC
jgi:hypothetical protein